MDTMKMSKRLYRSKVDHLTDKPFKRFKCKECNKYYLRMKIDKEMNVQRNIIQEEEMVFNSEWTSNVKYLNGI